MVGGGEVGGGAGGGETGRGIIEGRRSRVRRKSIGSVTVAVVSNSRVRKEV